MQRKQILLGIFLKGCNKDSNCLITLSGVSLNVPPCCNWTTQVPDFTRVTGANVQGQCTELLK